LGLRLDMLQAASRAKGVLGRDAEKVAEFLTDQVNDDGGFRGRGDQSDLYFTVFGLSGLLALGSKLPGQRIVGFIEGFQVGEGLDLVHLACLARCRASLRLGADDLASLSILAGVERHRSADGGYNPIAGSSHGSAYGCFLAIGAYQDLSADLADEAEVARCLESLRSQDGGFNNSPGMEMGATAATAAAMVAMAELRRPVDGAAGGWLLDRCLAGGGFLAMPGLTRPDLLSTATALHALGATGCDLRRIERVKKPCREFVRGLWHPAGGFGANTADRQPDCEHTFYSLLALGHLSD